jgi:hypothetical protein
MTSDQTAPVSEDRRGLYPTPEHARAAEAVVAFFSALPGVEAVLLTCSCARGKASRDSCLDIDVLATPETMRRERATWEDAWHRHDQSAPVFQALRAVGKYSQVDLDFNDGDFVPQPRGWTSGPDEFELGIGNLLAYSVPLWQGGDYYQRLREKWLPYYGEELRRERLAAVRRFCFNNLDHIPLYVPRGLYFQAFRRLYDAQREFLQALFISRRVYPIAYDKWIQEQIVEILGLPELYPQLLSILEISDFDSEQIAERGEQLARLYAQFVPG